MLAGDGEPDEALVHLHRASDDGDPAGFWGIGKIHEQRGNWVAAAEAYRRGAELGDAACAYGLGVSLYEQGDHVGSRAAFQHATELGHDGAADVLAAFRTRKATRRTGEVRPSVGGGAVVERHWSLRGACISETRTWPAMGPRRRSLFKRRRRGSPRLEHADEDIRKRFTTICGRFETLPEPGRKHHFETPIPASSPSEWLSAANWSGWIVGFSRTAGPSVRH